MTMCPRFAAIAALMCSVGPGLAQTTPRHFSTYLGGSGRDNVTAVAAAPNGDLVVAGHSDSSDLPVTIGAFQPNPAGRDDVFVARLSPDGSQILALTYLGGTQRDFAYHVEVTDDGSIWVGGSTESADFPVTPDAFSAPNRFDAFVAELDGNLTTLRYATAFGGLNSDRGQAFVIDEPNQRIYIAGTAPGTSIPTTATALRSTVQSGDAFLAVLDRSVPGQTSLAYGTYLGGSGFELEVHDLTVDVAGIATVTGTTRSDDLPVTTGAVQSSRQGTDCGYILSVDPNQAGTAGLVYGSYFGGSGNEESLHHVVDASGIVHLMAISPSPDLPTTPNAMQSSSGASLDAFYAQLDPTASVSAGLVYGSWIAAGNSGEGQSVGNPAHDVSAAIALGPTGPAIFVTTSSSSGLAVTPGAFQPFKSAFHGYAMVLDVTTGPDPFVAYATHYRGCDGHVMAGDVAFHPSGDLLLGGWSDNLPVTPGVAQFQHAGGFDGYVARLEPAPWPSAFRSFGATCNGTAGTPTLLGVSPPRLCGSMGLQLTGLPQGQIGAIYFGRSNTWAGIPLPAALAPIGGGSCFVHVGLNVVLPLPTGTGTASFNVPVPKQPALVGQEVFLQYVCADLGANPLGVVTTNGLAAEVRW